MNGAYRELLAKRRTRSGEGCCDEIAVSKEIGSVQQQAEHHGEVPTGLYRLVLLFEGYHDRVYDVRSSQLVLCVMMSKFQLGNMCRNSQSRGLEGYL